MTTSIPTVGVFILAKNEAPNISRSLAALAPSGWAIHVLDSGSTDGTQALVGSYPAVSVLSYTYVDHCSAYNEISTTLGRDFHVVLVLDADMIVSAQLQWEISRQIDSLWEHWDALRAPIEMWVDGSPISRGSLCPPKPFAFKTGRALFVSTGHAERLADDVRVHDVAVQLVHDDRKDYAAFLQSQLRYAEKLVSRYRQAAVSGRDRLRVRTPLLIVIVPFVSYVLRGGIFAGRAGILYALDRLIAEAIMYRRAVAMRLESDSSRLPSNKQADAHD